MGSDHIDDVLVTLSDPRRRHVLYYLRHHDTANIEELADVLTGWLTVEDDIVVTPKRRQDVRLSLYHSHLPALADADLVTYDQPSGDVSLEPLPDYVDALLAETLRDEREELPRRASVSNDPSPEG